MTASWLHRCVGPIVLVVFAASQAPTARATVSSNGHVVGTQNSDELEGSARGDRIEGRGGGDYLDGLGGSDLLLGGTGHDVIHGGFGNDVLVAGSGDDELYGDDGDDVLIGGRGSDRLDGFAGWDRAQGGPGRDFIDVRGAEGDVADCGPGLDVVRADPLDRVGIDCERQTFLSIEPRAADGRRTRTIRFVSQNDGDGDVVELRGPPGTSCERLHSVYSLRGPLEGLQLGDIERFRFGVRLRHAPEHRRFHPRNRRAALTTLCRGQCRAELKVEHCGEGGGCERTPALERFYFRVV